MGSDWQSGAVFSPGKDSSASAGLIEVDAVKLRNKWRSLFLNPVHEACRVVILHPGQLVERLVVKLFEDRRKHVFDVAKVHGPAKEFVKRGVEVEPQTVGVAMDSEPRIARGGATKPE